MQGHATSLWLALAFPVLCACSVRIMNSMSALEEALDILPFTVTVDTKAVKEAVINQVAQELCTTLRQRTPSRAASPEVSSSAMLGPSSSTSAGSLGFADFMDPQVLKTAKMWRFQKLSKAELGGLVEHFTKSMPSSGATKGSSECGRECKIDAPFPFQVLFIRQKTQSCLGFPLHCWFASAAFQGLHQLQ
ncbi:TPA: hypothetical protein ACH3X1_016627 [Trebouxia sp. C0004]